MGKIQIGHVDEIKAFGIDHLKILWLVGKGTNPTTGWKNWFEPERAPNQFAFKQESPDGIVAQVVMPFIVMNVFPLPAGNDVIVQEIDAGETIQKRVPIERSLCPVEEAMFAALTPHLVTTHATLTGRAPKTNFRLHLGTFDLPFGCATWSNPTRAKRFDIYLEVDVIGAQDVQSAVDDCLKQSAVATALALLLTPIGWAEGPAVFAQVLQACLATKLTNILSVQISADNHCL